MLSQDYFEMIFSQWVRDMDTLSFLEWTCAEPVQVHLFYA